MTAYNEDRAIIPVCMEIARSMGKREYEIVFVDDGSTDKTHDKLKGISDSRLRIMRLDSRMGKCAALYRGMENSRGKIIATMDADLQDDPEDLVRMLDYMDKGYDFVCGWRRDRKDGHVKRVCSLIGNMAINSVFGMSLHDHACPIKVFRRECVSGVKHFKGAHRFMGVLAGAKGFCLAESVVNHRPRVYGRSKCGVISKLGTLKGILMVRSMVKNLEGGGVKG